jgi:hypothetical protein
MITFRKQVGQIYAMQNRNILFTFLIPKIELPLVIIGGQEN